MKWILKKQDEDCIIKVSENEEEKDFSYIEMIKGLYLKQKLDEPDYEGDFSDDEKESVQELIKEINIHVDKFFENEGKSEIDVMDTNFHP